MGQKALSAVGVKYWDSVRGCISCLVVYYLRKEAVNYW